MQELFDFLEHFRFLSEHNHVFSVLVLVLLFISIIIAIAAQSSASRQRKAAEKNNKELRLTIEENSSDFRDQFIQLARGNKGLLDAVRKEMNDEIREIKTSVGGLAETVNNNLGGIAETIASTNNASKENSEGIHALFEKQGVFLHDRFSELSSSEEKRLQDVRQTITAQLHEQDRRVENIQTILTQQSGQQSENIETLRDGITSQLADLMSKERALQQEVQTQMTTLISDAINRLAGEMDAKLALITDKVSTRFNENLASTMESFNSLQNQIDAFIAAKNELDALGQDVTSLTRMILNKSSGGITASHLPDMLAAMLPDDAYILNPMINGHTAAAQLMLPGDQGAVIVDSSLPLADYDSILAPELSESERQDARQRFGDSVCEHINFVADNFILPPATGSNAMLFVSSETAFAEIQAHHKACVELAVTRQIWMVSPTTLAAALNMARSALKDQKARAQLEQMRKALQQIAHEAQNFEARLLEIGDHINNAMRSVQRAESAGVKLFGDVRGIAGAGEANESAKALPDSTPHSN